MTSLKDQMKLLKDAGKGAVEGIYKSIIALAMNLIYPIWHKGY